MERPIIVRVADVPGEERDPPRVSRLLLSGKNVGAKKNLDYSFYDKIGLTPLCHRPSNHSAWQRILPET